MRAIVLAGGFGTRLKTVLPDTPKPMAPIQAKPFLVYLLNYLSSQGITSIIFSVHHLREKIQDYFGNRFAHLEIDYVIEDKPLGTGGAIVKALSSLQSEGPIFVLNGDTFAEVNYSAMYAQHQASGPCFTMALRQVEDCERFGKVLVNHQQVMSFKEKGEKGPGLINTGVYLINKDTFLPYALPARFSIETEFLYPHIQTLRPNAFITQGYFIDIGIPEDYARAQQELLAFGT